MIKKLIILLIQGYTIISKYMWPAQCRFYPTCSSYMIEAIHEFGIIKGMIMGIKRISKCHPFHAGGSDPVVQQKSTITKIKDL